MTTSEENEFHALLARHREGALTEKETIRLREWIREDREAMALFCASGEIDGRLRWEYFKNAECPPSAGQAPATHPMRKRGWKKIAAAAAVAVLAGSAVLLSLNTNSGALPKKGPARTVARITHANAALWAKPAASQVAVGEWLEPGVYQLSEGEIVIEFDSGGVLVASSPSSFEIISEEEVTLRAGAIRARMHEAAVGFRVQTPSGTLVDLGTEFSVSVDEQGQTELEVIEGAVRAITGHREERLRQDFSTDQRIRMTTGRIDPVPAADRQSQLNDLAWPKNYKGPPARWFHWSFNQIRDDGSFAQSSGTQSPQDLTLHPMRSDPERSQPPTSGEGLHGNCASFSGTGGYLQGSYEGPDGTVGLTVSVWVRVPKTALPENAYNFVGWGVHAGWDDSEKWQLGWNPQYVHPNWNAILPTGALRGGVRTEFAGGWVIGTTDLRDSEWHHVVCVCGGIGRSRYHSSQIRHYIDGRLEGVSSSFSKEPSLSKFEPRRSMTVGDHLGTSKWDFFEGFTGDLDELYIFEGALTPSQVWTLFEHNQPPGSNGILPSVNRAHTGASSAAF